MDLHFHCPGAHGVCRCNADIMRKIVRLSAGLAVLGYSALMLVGCGNTSPPIHSASFADTGSIENIDAVISDNLSGVDAAMLDSESSINSDCECETEQVSAPPCQENPTFKLLPVALAPSATLGVHELSGVVLPAWVRKTKTGLWIGASSLEGKNDGTIVRVDGTGAILQSVLLDPSKFDATKGMMRLLSADTLERPDGTLLTVGRAETSAQWGGVGALRCWFGSVSPAGDLADVHAASSSRACSHATWVDKDPSEFFVTGSAGNVTMTNYEPGAAFVARMNVDGAVVWDETIAPELPVLGTALLASGCGVIAGFSEAPTLVRYSGTGAVEWSAGLSELGNHVGIAALAPADSDHFIAMGWASSVAVPEHTCWIARMDAAANVQWVSWLGFKMSRPGAIDVAATGTVSAALLDNGDGEGGFFHVVSLSSTGNILTDVQPMPMYQVSHSASMQRTSSGFVVAGDALLPVQTWTRMTWWGLTDMQGHAVAGDKCQTGVDCADADPCTLEDCDPAVGCQSHAAKSGMTCGKGKCAYAEGSASLICKEK
jgi:hypothetical protein